MPRTSRDVPPPLELLCLNALWNLGEGNVRDVQEIVVRTRPLAYTTIMTVLDRLVRKGKLSRRKAGRAFIYRPEASREAMRRAAVRELVDSLFDGSETGLIEFLAPAEPAPAVEERANAAAAGAGGPAASIAAHAVESNSADAPAGSIARSSVIEPKAAAQAEPESAAEPEPSLDTVLL